MREITEAIKAEIKEMTISYFAEECEVDPSEITMETNPQDDLGSDSLMFVELIEVAKEKYDLDIQLQSIGKYLLKSPMNSMSELIDMMYKVYSYGNDIVNL